MIKKYRKTLFIILIILITLPIIHLGLSAIIYNQIFNTRYETLPPYNYQISEFDNLCRQEYNFESNKGQELAGYLYYYNEINDPTGLVYVVHGLGGGGHMSYMECIYYFTKNNFVVFSYDCTGNDNSEGKSVRGIPQQLIDLDYAMRFVSNNLDNINDLPIMLFGHSWGGYAVTNILNFYDNINAVVSIAGFNTSKDIIKTHAEEYVGGFVNFLLPSVMFHEKIKFGKYSSSNALSGFENSEADVMIVHSEDDDTVPIECGYELYYEKYKNDSRFTFIKYENKGHSNVFRSNDAINAIDEINLKFNEWLKTLDYDYSSKKNIDKFIEDKRNYIMNLDRNIFCNMIDIDLFTRIVDFYENSI